MRVLGCWDLRVFGGLGFQDLGLFRVLGFRDLGICCFAVLRFRD